MRVRFAPSPTGALHIGGARTALFDWLLARHSGGTFLLRIEDTDREHSTPENVEQILDALRWLRARLGQGPDLQGERAARHQEVLEALLEGGHAYRSNATAADVAAYKQLHGAERGFRGEGLAGAGGGGAPARAGRWRHRRTRPDPRRHNLRTRAPRRSGDRARGRFVLYNFAVAIDDLDAGITHVVRGEDHLSNTPKQLLVLQAAKAAGFGAEHASRCMRTCRCCTAPTARSSPSATAPRRCRSCAKRATCRRRCATTSPCSAGARATTPPSLDRATRESASSWSASVATRPASTRSSCAGSTGSTSWALGTDSPIAYSPTCASTDPQRQVPQKPIASCSRVPWRSARRRFRRSPTSGRCRASSSRSRRGCRGARALAWRAGSIGVGRCASAALLGAELRGRGGTDCACASDRAPRRKAARGLRAGACGNRGHDRFARHLRERRAARSRGDLAPHRSRARRLNDAQPEECFSTPFTEVAATGY